MFGVSETPGQRMQWSDYSSSPEDTPLQEEVTMQVSTGLLPVRPLNSF